MKSINFDEGFEEYAINNDPNRVIRLRLADPNLMNRIDAAMEKTTELFAKYKDQEAKKLPEFDAEVKALINEAFGSDICTPAFGSANIASLGGDGQPIFYSFMNELMKILEIESSRVKEKIQVRPEVQKYLEPAVTAQSELPDVSNLTPEQKRELLSKLI